MSYQPVVPMGGYAGWRFLQRTLPQQQAALSASAPILRDEAYFREKIGAINSAEELVGDRRLLKVALTAFGLQDDIANRAYLKKVLESRVADNGSFANRLADKRYRQLAQAFAFGDRTVPRTKLATFPDEILTRFRDRSFEIAVGQSNDTMRVALALQRDLKALAEQPTSDLARWYTVLGTPNLRTVFEQAFNLPASFGTLDLDRQVQVLRERTERLTGQETISQFANPAALETLTQRYFLGAEIAQITRSGVQNTALILLQSGQNSLAALRGR